MENTEIVMNNEVTEAAAEIVTKANSKVGTAALVVAGIVALGGATALVIKKLKAKKNEAEAVCEAEEPVVEDDEEDIDEEAE